MTYRIQDRYPQEHLSEGQEVGSTCNEAGRSYCRRRKGEIACSPTEVCRTRAKYSQFSCSLLYLITRCYLVKILDNGVRPEDIGKLISLFNFRHPVIDVVGGLTFLLHLLSFIRIELSDCLSPDLFDALTW